MYVVRFTSNTPTARFEPFKIYAEFEGVCHKSLEEAKAVAKELNKFGSYTYQQYLQGKGE